MFPMEEESPPSAEIPGFPLTFVIVQQENILSRRQDCPFVDLLVDYTQSHDEIIDKLS